MFSMPCISAVVVRIRCNLAVCVAAAPMQLSQRRKPCPKGPAPVLIAAMVEMMFGFRRIAQQRSFIFVRCRDRQGCRSTRARQALPARARLSGPLLWSADLHCESLLLRTHTALQLPPAPADSSFPGAIACRFNVFFASSLSSASATCSWSAHSANRAASSVRPSAFACAAIVP